MDSRDGARAPIAIPSRVPMGVGDSKTRGGLVLEIKLDHHGGFAAHNPSIMTRLDRHRLRRGEFHYATILVLDMNLPMGQKSDVRVLAEAASDDRLHVRGPTKAGRIDEPFYSPRSSRNNVHFNAGDDAVRRVLDRRD